MKNPTNLFPIRLFIHTPNNNIITFAEINPEATVYELKSQLELRSGILAELQSLYLSNIKLEDNKKLSSGKIKNGSVLRVKIKERSLQQIYLTACLGKVSDVFKLGVEFMQDDQFDENIEQTIYANGVAKEDRNSSQMIVSNQVKAWNTFVPLRAFQALFAACFGGHVELIAKLLKDATANVNMVTKNRHSVLHLAAYQGHLACVSFLLSKGADSKLMDLEGMTALSFASLNGHVKIEKHLWLFNWNMDVLAGIEKQQVTNGQLTEQQREVIEIQETAKKYQTQYQNSKQKQMNKCFSLPTILADHLSISANVNNGGVKNKIKLPDIISQQKDHVKSPLKPKNQRQNLPRCAALTKLQERRASKTPSSVISPEVNGTMKSNSLSFSESYLREQRHVEATQPSLNCKLSLTWANSSPKSSINEASSVSITKMKPQHHENHHGSDKIEKEESVIDQVYSRTLNGYAGKIHKETKITKVDADVEEKRNKSRIATVNIDSADLFDVPSVKQIIITDRDKVKTLLKVNPKRISLMAEGAPDETCDYCLNAISSVEQVNTIQTQTDIKIHIQGQHKEHSAPSISSCIKETKSPRKNELLLASDFSFKKATSEASSPNNNTILEPVEDRLSKQSELQKEGPQRFTNSWPVPAEKKVPSKVFNLLPEPRLVPLNNSLTPEHSRPNFEYDLSDLYLNKIVIKTPSPPLWKPEVSHQTETVKINGRFVKTFEEWLEEKNKTKSQNKIDNKTDEFEDIKDDDDENTTKADQRKEAYEQWLAAKEKQLKKQKMLPKSLDTSPQPVRRSRTMSSYSCTFEQWLERKRDMTQSKSPLPTSRFDSDSKKHVKREKIRHGMTFEEWKSWKNKEKQRQLKEIAENYENSYQTLNDKSRKDEKSATYEQWLRRKEEERRIDNALRETLRAQHEEDKRMQKQNKYNDPHLKTFEEWLLEKDYAMKFQKTFQQNETDKQVEKHPDDSNVIFDMWLVNKFTLEMSEEREKLMKLNNGQQFGSMNSIQENDYIYSSDSDTDFDSESDEE